MHPPTLPLYFRPPPFRSFLSSPTLSLGGSFCARNNFRWQTYLAQHKGSFFHRLFLILMHFIRLYGRKKSFCKRKPIFGTQNRVWKPRAMSSFPTSKFQYIWKTTTNIKQTISTHYPIFSLLLFVCLDCGPSHRQLNRPFPPPPPPLWHHCSSRVVAIQPLPIHPIACDQERRTSRPKKRRPTVVQLDETVCLQRSLRGIGSAHSHLAAQ